MKKLFHLMAAGAVLTLSSCGGGGEKPQEDTTDESSYSSQYTYEISIDSTEKTKAPDLQSFVHAVNGSDWLLFAGRTNSSNNNGGIHDMNTTAADYAAGSFPPPSFNETVYVYNVDADQQWSLPLSGLNTIFKDLSENHESDNVKEAFTSLLSSPADLFSIFRCSNPQVTQDDTYLYVVGGYGFPWGSDSVSANYQTFSTVARINIDLMIQLVKAGSADVTTDWSDLIRLTSNTTLAVTGGELHKIGSTFYLCGGHNYAFNNSTPGQKFGQKYSDAVYPFTLDAPAGSSAITATVGTAITDIPLDSIPTQWGDNNSNFRRRDGPFVPTLYSDGTNLSQSVTFYGGVFTPNFTAWNDALVVYPSTSGGNLDAHLIDSANFNMGNYNVYSCADFGVYDSTTNLLHTFLPGGIGNGQNDGNLSAFTNTGLHAVLDLGNNTNSTVIPPDTVFFPRYDSLYFGAEAAFMEGSSVANSKLVVNGNESDLFDTNKLFSGDGNSVDIGYIYGGIQAYQASPGNTSSKPGFGNGFSGATNMIWKVTLTRTPLELEK